MVYGSRMNSKVCVRDVMNSPVITISPDAKADAIAKKTDTDLVEKVVAKNAKPDTLSAFKILSSPLKTIDFKEDLPEAARLIRKLTVKRLGVVRDGNLIGLVSLSDVLAVTPELIKIVSEEARIMTGRSRIVRGSIEGYCDSCGNWSESLQAMDRRYLCRECRMGNVAELPEE